MSRRATCPPTRVGTLTEPMVLAALPATEPSQRTIPVAPAQRPGATPPRVAGSNDERLQREVPPHWA